MDRNEILAAIEEEITRLQKARELLAENGETGKVAKHRGRPASRVNRTIAVKVNPPRRRISEEGRARIAAAQKKRWAAQTKASKGARPISRKSIPGTKSSKKLASRPKERTLANNAAAVAKPAPETPTAEA